MSVKTRILIISDTHCAPLSGISPIPPFKSPLPKADLLIHCGDLTYNGGFKEYETTLDMLKEIDAPVKLVIAGNHDKSLDRDYVLSHLELERITMREGFARWMAARELWTSPEGRAHKEGITFLDEGHHQVDLPNGASINVYASPYTPEFYDYGFPYERNEDRFNSPAFVLSDAKGIAPYPITDLSSGRRPVDIVITHGPPHARMDRPEPNLYAGCPHLLRAVMRARPLLHCFGHIHEGWGAELVRWSEAADAVTATSSTIKDWSSAGWKKGVLEEGEAVKKINPDLKTAKEDRAVFVDVSETSSEPIKRGAATLMINAAIMNVRYRPVNAPCK